MSTRLAEQEQKLDEGLSRAEQGFEALATEARNIGAALQSKSDAGETDLADETERVNRLADAFDSLKAELAAPPSESATPTEPTSEPVSTPEPVEAVPTDAAPVESPPTVDATPSAPPLSDEGVAELEDDEPSAL